MWFVDPALRGQLEAAEASGVMYSSQQQAEYMAAVGSDLDGSRLFTAPGVINVRGIMTNTPNFFAMLFGGGNVTYSEIVSAVKAADGDARVNEIMLVVDSNGGHVDGLFSALDAIRGASKPVRAFIENKALSAAYALVSQAGEIVARGPEVRVGSVGVLASIPLKRTASSVDVTSTRAPLKRPDVETPEGRAAVESELDDLHKVFVSAIAAGRGVTPDDVNEKYGRGGVLLAEDALARGMIDAISSAIKTPAISGANSTEVNDMDQLTVATVQSQAPGVYSEIIAAGVKQERDRVLAHLMLGESAGAMDLAVSSIRAGEDLTPEKQREYMQIVNDRADVARRAADDAAAESALRASGPAPEPANAVLAIVEQAVGM